MHAHVSTGIFMGSADLELGKYYNRVFISSVSQVYVFFMFFFVVEEHGSKF